MIASTLPHPPPCMGGHRRRVRHRPPLSLTSPPSHLPPTDKRTHQSPTLIYSRWVVFFLAGYLSFHHHRGNIHEASGPSLFTAVAAAAVRCVATGSAAATWTIHRRSPTALVVETSHPSTFSFLRPTSRDRDRQRRREEQRLLPSSPLQFYHPRQRIHRRL